MRRCLILLFLPLLLLPLTSWAGDSWRVGTWKTAQTIQPFFYERFTDSAVTVLPFTNPADQKAALLAGSLDICGTTLAHAIASASRGEPVVVVASLCEKCSALVVRSDGPVHGVEDLAGKTIGYVPGTMHEILLRETLRKHGLAPDRSVTLLRVDFFDMGAALAKGSIDAFLSGEPFPSLAVRQGFGRVLAHPYYDDGIGPLNAALLVTRQAVRTTPDKVLAQVAAHARATELLRADRELWLRQATQFGIDRDVLDLAIPNMELIWDMDEDFLGRVKALGQRMLDLGIIEVEPDYDSLVDRGFVSRYRQEP